MSRLDEVYNLIQDMADGVDTITQGLSEAHETLFSIGANLVVEGMNDAVNQVGVVDTERKIALNKADALRDSLRRIMQAIEEVRE